MDLRPELGFSGQIWAILLGFGPLWLNLGHFPEIWAILLGIGLFGRNWVRIGPKGDEALMMRWGGDGRTYGQTDGRTDGQTDGQTDRNSPCVLEDFVPFRAAALLPINFNTHKLKQGKGTDDHILPVGDWFPHYPQGGGVIMSGPRCVKGSGP